MTNNNVELTNPVKNLLVACMLDDILIMSSVYYTMQYWQQLQCCSYTVAIIICSTFNQPYDITTLANMAVSHPFLILLYDMTIFPLLALLN